MRAAAGLPGALGYYLSGRNAAAQLGIGIGCLAEKEEAVIATRIVLGAARARGKAQDQWRCGVRVRVGRGVEWSAAPSPAPVLLAQK